VSRRPASSRRELLRGAVGAALALAPNAASPGGALAAAVVHRRLPPPAVAKPIDDQTILRKSLELEQVVVAAYTFAAASPWAGARRATLSAIGAQEREHAAALAAYLRQMSIALPAPLSGPAALDALVPGLRAARSEHELLATLVGLERVAVANYYLGIQRLVDQRLVETVAGVLGAESQHLVVLRLALGQEPLPGANETGVAPVGTSVYAPGGATNGTVKATGVR
jgi:hypothetical protein